MGRPKGDPVDGVLLLAKPARMTSSAAVAKARWLLGARKAGHTGTLDPLAEGLLPLTFGEAAEFATMTPHALATVDGPAELVMIFDRDGQRAHVHREADGHPTT